MKKFILAAALVAVAVPAFAQGYGRPIVGRGYVEDEIVTGSLRPAPGYADPYGLPGTSADRISRNPAADGNANLQTRPSPNYGNVSGGYESAR